MAWLVAIDGELSGRKFSLDAPCLVGRGPYNHIILDDTRISRQHAKISPESGGHVVYDLNSANGTFVNDVQVKRQKLAPNDVVRFGPFTFRFSSDSVETSKHPVKASPNKFVPEVLTSVGPSLADEPADIIGSLDASTATNPGLVAGLREMEDADRKLRTLYQFLQSVSATLDVNELLDRILANLLETFADADTAVVYLSDPETGELEPRRLQRRSPTTPPRPVTFPGQFHEDVMMRGRAILIAPTLTPSPRAQTPKTAKKKGSGMHAPILYGNVAHGVLHVRAAEDSGAPFSQSDLDLLTGIASQAALALQNARMHAESLRQQRLQQDLLLAEQIQKSFLPRALPQVEGIEFSTEYRPAYSVGGDFYDVFWVNYDRIGVFIGDVSGKGVSAALLMARISSDLRLAAAHASEPAQAMAHVNRIVVERRQPDIFVTAIFFTLDVKTHEVTIANAGHLPPFVRRSEPGVLERVEGGAGTAIGIFDDAEYEQVRFKLEPGDTLVVCTDGILEATNSGSEQFGFEKLEKSLKTGSSRAGDLTARLMRDVRGHVGEAAQYDDLTLIVCGVSDTTAERMKRRDEPTQSVTTLK